MENGRFPYSSVVYHHFEGKRRRKEDIFLAIPAEVYEKRMKWVRKK